MESISNEVLRWCRLGGGTRIGINDAIVYQFAGYSLLMAFVDSKQLVDASAARTL